MSRPDRESTDLAGAAYLAREDGYDERPDPSEYMDDDDLECTWCGGDGECDDGADPLGKCPDDFHPCHACGGSGRRSDQRIF